MTLSIETLGDSTSKISIRQLQHGPRPPFSSMSIEVAPGVQSPAFPIRLPSHTPNCRHVWLECNCDFVRLRHSALHLSFLLVRLGGFATDYFRGHPSALRPAGLSGARCGGFGEADARLITIGELDAGRLECTL